MKSIFNEKFEDIRILNTINSSIEPNRKVYMTMRQRNKYIKKKKNIKEKKKMDNRIENIMR